MSGADAGPLVAHSQARMLHPAALLDFEAHVQGLLARGERDQAVRLWQEVAVAGALSPNQVSEFRIQTGVLREVPAWWQGVLGAQRCWPALRSVASIGRPSSGRGGGGRQAVSLGKSRHMSRSPPATGRVAMGPLRGPGRLWASGLLALQRESVFFPGPSHGTSSGTGRSARNASAIWSLWGILSGIYARLAGDGGGQWDRSRLWGRWALSTLPGGGASTGFKMMRTLRSPSTRLKMR